MRYNFTYGVVLKRCPFCGNEQSLFVGGANEISDDEREIGFAVCCDFNNGGCGATGGYRSTEKEAVMSWNKRTVRESMLSDDSSFVIDNTELNTFMKEFYCS